MKLDSLIAPRSVAVIGASDDPDRLGGRVFANMLKGYAGPVTPINPRHARVQGVPSYPSLAALDSVPDLALVVSPPRAVLKVAQECAEVGVPSMIVITAGFAETGDEGRALQDQLAAIAREAGIALLGPNCVGVLSLPISMRASFVRLTGIPMRTGPAAVVSQSGAVGLAIFEYAQERGLGVSYLCTTGNEAQLSCADLIGDVVERPDVRVVMAYLEGIRDVDALLQAGQRALELGKPVLVMKAGASRVGQRAAASHTGAIAVPDRVIDAVLDQAGMVRARSMRQLLDYAKVSAGRIPAGRRTVILTGSGGVGVTMADAAEEAGLDLAPPGPELAAELEPVVPPIGSIGNPIDHTAQLLNMPGVFDKLLRIVTSADEYDIAVIANVSRTHMPGIVDLLGDVTRQTAQTIVTQTHYAEIAAELTRRDIPCVEDAVATLEALGAMVAWRREQLARAHGSLPLRAAPVRSSGPGRPLPAARAQRLLERYGISMVPFVNVSDEDAAAAAFVRSFRPVAVKVDAAWMAHKSEYGGVVLGCQTEDAVRQAYRRLRGLADGAAPSPQSASIIIQDMAEPGLEFVCGAYRDPVFGPLVTVGLGGVLVELINDAALALAPVTPARVGQMLRGLARGRLIGHPRGISADKADAVADVVVALSELICAEPTVVEVDLNPLIAGPSTVYLVDALVMVSDEMALLAANEAG